MVEKASVSERLAQLEQMVSVLTTNLDRSEQENREMRKRLRAGDSVTIHDEARRRYERSCELGAPKGEHTYYVVTRDYALPVVYRCDDTDLIIVKARYEAFYGTKFNDAQQEILTEAEWRLRTAR